MKIKKIINSSYEIINAGLVFKVLNAEAYPAEKISKQYKKLLTIESKHLVAINHRGTLIPNITLKDGVVRITSIEIDGKTINKPKAISEALGIKVAMEGYFLVKLA